MMHMTGWGHLVCAIVTHCVRKSICDSPLSKWFIRPSQNDFNCIKRYSLKKNIFRAKHVPYMRKALRKAIMKRSRLESK